MAAVGMKYLTFAPVATEASNTITYSTGKVAEHAIRGDVTYNYDESDLYGDDIKAEHYRAITDYDMTIEMTELGDDISELLGIEAKTTATNVTTYHLVGDNTTACGVGFVQCLIINGAKSYHGYWFHKVSFTLNAENSQTRGASIEWQTPTLNGKGWGVMLDSSGKAQYRDRQVFTSEADALAWLKGKAGIQT